MENQKWKLQGHLVEYSDQDHQYMVDGVKVPSVTQVLKFRFPNKYKDVDPAILSQAATRGTILHQIIQDYEEVGVESTAPELYHYKFLKKSYGFKFKEAEVPILITFKDDLSEEKYICGRLDQVIEINGKTALNDFKFVSTMDAEYKEYLAYQLNMYRLGYEQTYNKKIEKLYGTWLKITATQEHRKFIELPINEAMIQELLKNYYNRKEEVKTND